jgi:hypothetical protein
MKKLLKLLAKEHRRRKRIDDIEGSIDGSYVPAKKGGTAWAHEMSCGSSHEDYGGGRQRADKSRFYRMAKRSATECAAILDVAQTRRCISSDNYSQGRALL